MDHVSIAADLIDRVQAAPPFWLQTHANLQKGNAHRIETEGHPDVMRIADLLTGCFILETLRQGLTLLNLQVFNQRLATDIIVATMPIDRARSGAATGKQG